MIATKPKQERRELKRLYSLIPTFKCIEGCSDCCGPVPASREERKAAPSLMSAETMLDVLGILEAGGASAEELKIAPELSQWSKNKFGQACISCPYVLENGGGCAIYDNRPFLCRLFGTIPGMPCPHGAGPERMLTKAEERSLMRKYVNIVAGRNMSE